MSASALSPAEALGMLTDMAAVRRDNEHDAGVCNELLLPIIERARVVGVLDSWAARFPGERAWLSAPNLVTDLHPCVCVLKSAAGHRFNGATPDEARAAAAKAIETGEV